MTDVLDWRSRALLAESEESRLRAEVERFQAIERQRQQLTPYNHLVVRIAQLEAEVERLQVAAERAATLLRANQTSAGVSEEIVNDVLGVLYGRW